ncbi:exodeoxyribonuclease VII large subunit [Salmonella enterica subsp. enterica]|uniref:Exodeoxyribonuclease VII large subunit n=1 Tax=Salmonella enterica I TaxID=59201 RepID=A0A447N6D3_SALET|nr:exodeoxyribonuclease VII large subunit [Salmonella enterica subsp. enterica]
MITSKTGAALHDILHVLKRRDPSLPVIIYPTAVQGDDAPGQIVRAIELANARGECDVLIIGRGGGSLEDLWSFNDERVARVIFASRIPVVSAVGHETDVTIADFVADLRAPTPSAAAEIVSRNQQELLRQIQSAQQRLGMAMDYYLANRSRRFTQIFHRLQQQHPQLRLARQQTALERLRQRMGFALEARIKQANQRQQRVSQRLSQQKSAAAHSPRAVAHPTAGISSDGEYPLTVKRTARAFWQRGHASGSGQPVSHAGARLYGFDDNGRQGAEKDQNRSKQAIS